MSTCKNCGREFKNVKALAGHMHRHTMTPEKSKNYSNANRRRFSAMTVEERSEHMRPAVEASMTIRQTDEYRQTLRDAARFAWPDERRVEYSKKFSGSGNPRWKFAREFVDFEQNVVDYHRCVFKKAKKNIFCGALDIEIEELGYTARDLKSHVEKLFTDGMTWKNWGEWHIDHIFPVSRFSFGTSPATVNALSNLRPLWAAENLSKAAKVMS